MISKLEESFTEEETEIHTHPESSLELPLASFPTHESASDLGLQSRGWNSAPKARVTYFCKLSFIGTQPLAGT